MHLHLICWSEIIFIKHASWTKQQIIFIHNNEREWKHFFLTFVALLSLSSSSLWNNGNNTIFFLSMILCNILIISRLALTLRLYQTSSLEFIEKKSFVQIFYCQKAFNYKKNVVPIESYAIIEEEFTELVVKFYALLLPLSLHTAAFLHSSTLQSVDKNFFFFAISWTK